MATQIQRDVLPKTNMDDKKKLLVIRMFVVIIVALSCVFSVTTLGTYIQTFIFLSYGMRTTVFLIPMLAAFYFKGKLTRSAGIAAAVAGPVMDIIAYFVMGPAAPMYSGDWAHPSLYLSSSILWQRIGSKRSSCNYR